MTHDRINDVSAARGRKSWVARMADQWSADGEDVEFSLDEADDDDLEALARAEAANRRARGKEGRKS